MTINDETIFKKASFPINYTLFNFKLKLMWYNNPKCCSSTIKSIIRDKDKWRKLYHFEKKETYKYKSFGFVRNPYNRLFSAYRMLKVFKVVSRHMSNNYDLKSEKRYPSVDFDHFVHDIYEGYYWNDHLEPQINFLPVTLKEVRQLDFIGKVENFADDWMRMQRVLNYRFIEDKTSIPIIQPKSLTDALNLKTNEAVYRSLKKKMNKKTAQIIQELYKDDFINFGYDIEDFGDFKIT